LIQIDPRAAQEVRSELFSGETIRWAARPNPNKIFHSDDWAVIPFSAAWLGFFVFWEADALGLVGFSKPGRTLDTFFVLWGIPFLLVGNYMLWGRFLWDAWLKRGTFYAITNRRVLIVQRGLSFRTFSVFPNELSTIEREGTRSGTLWLGPKYPIVGARGQKKRAMSRFAIGDVPVLADIDNVDAIHSLLLDLRGGTQV
jgi:hypothetical protein